jgi:hypothetical protein
MTLTVRERAETIATFRHIEVRLMETLARWVPSTPEMEVKILLGRHVWEVAQHADALGKRTYELRAAMHFTQRPADDYIAFLDALDQATGGADRLHALYDITFPALTVRYESFLAKTDELLDAPSVKVVRRIVGDMAAMRGEADALRVELPALSASSDLSSLRMAEATVSQFVVHRARAPQETTA